ncbi:MAG TPA: restriction endonuclease [Pyrinomonadaceae bacterium]|jgi:hypothetical protein
MSDWVDFEQLAAQIYRELLPHAKVTYDDHIMGHDSKVLRQIDVSIRYSIVGHNQLMIVQARDKTRPADINAVGEFATVIRDVRANKGILICRGGFTSGAKSLADDLGIDLCNIHDAESRRWTLEIKLPIIWKDLLPTVRFRFAAKFEAGDSVSRDFRTLMISNDKGQTKIDLPTAFVNAWNTGELPRTVNAIHRIHLDKSVYELLVQNISGELGWRHIEYILLEYNVTQKTWLGEFTPEQCRGILNYKDGSFQPSYFNIGSIPIERDSSWKEIEDSEKLAISVPDYFITTERWQIDLNTAKFEDPKITLISK